MCAEQEAFSHLWSGGCPRPTEARGIHTPKCIFSHLLAFEIKIDYRQITYLYIFQRHVFFNLSETRFFQNGHALSCPTSLKEKYSVGNSPKR